MAQLNPFDAGIISFLNQFARRSWAFDYLMVLTTNYLFRVAGIVPLLWWAWFRNGESRTEKRDVLVFGMVGCLFSLAISRMLSFALPFRARPLHEVSLHFTPPYGQGNLTLLGWSSFPSDHAAVYFTVAMCLFFVSRKAGTLAMFWLGAITVFPRVYLGLHYPTDVLAGGLLGAGVASLSKISPVRGAFTGLFMRWHEKYPGPFYAVLFLYTLQLATAFDSVREVGDYLHAVANHAMQLVH